MRNICLFGLLTAAMALVSSSCAAGQAFLPDDGIDDRAGLQARIDEVAGAGGGVVQLESGTYDLAGPIFLRTNVTLAGRGPTTILYNARTNISSDWLGTVVFAGNLAPGNYSETDERGYPGLPAVQASETSVTIPNCDQRQLGPLVGEVVWLASAGGFSGTRGFFRTEYGKMNAVSSVNGCTIGLADTIGIPADQQLRLHWSDGSKRYPTGLGQPNRAIRDAGVTDVQLVSAEGQGMLVTGCYHCSFSNLTMGRTRRLFSVQGTRRSTYRNITGVFTERGIELAMFASDNTVENVQGTFCGEGRHEIRPAIRFGEYARDNLVQNVTMNLGPHYAKRVKIRFDESAGNKLKNVRLLVSKDDDRQLFVAKPPTSARAVRGWLPPGTSLEAVELIPSRDTNRCAPA